MTTEIKLASLPESVADATVLSWNVKVGDRVKRGEKLVDIETDKVLLDITAPADGVISEIITPSGTIIYSDSLLARLDETQTEIPKVDSESNDLSDEMLTAQEESKKLSPAVRHLLNQHQLDVNDIPASGKGGRLLKSDVLDFIAQDDATSTQPARISDTSTPIDNEQRVKRVPMSRLRAKVAERLLQSQQNTAMLTTFNELDMSSVMQLRKEYGDEFLKRYEVKLGFMSFFVKAVSDALREFPIINASVEDADIIYHNYYDVGIAVGSKRGLVVPVLRDCDELSFAQIEQQIAAYAKQSKDGSIDIEDIMGGTFTITNGGVFGSLLSTPIINPPQSAILGLHKIEKRAVVKTIDGKEQIVIRPMMYAALSYDHRIIDGSDAVQFLVAVKNRIEDPSRLLFSI